MLAQALPAVDVVVLPFLQAGRIGGEALRIPDFDLDPRVAVTVHPSSVLRGPPEDREKAFDGLVSDLRFAAGLLRG